jgi:hypothetical protein
MTGEFAFCAVDEEAIILDGVIVLQAYRNT